MRSWISCRRASPRTRGTRTGKTPGTGSSTPSSRPIDSSEATTRPPSTGSNARLAKIPGIDALRLTVKGAFLINWGWETRTDQVAANVTEEQFRTFEARLGEAREALSKAWELRPGEPHVAELMLMLEKGIGHGDRETMETWFERAMTVDGNSHQACYQKLDWLDPKWYGGDSFDQIIAFGRACAATKNWHNGITLLVADAHFRRWARLPQGPERAKYMRSPEVWNDIKGVYEEYFKHYPDDDVQRSKFAMICYLGAALPDGSCAVPGRRRSPHRLAGAAEDAHRATQEGPGAHGQYHGQTPGRRARGLRVCSGEAGLPGRSGGVGQAFQPDSDGSAGSDRSESGWKA